MTTYHAKHVSISTGTIVRFFAVVIGILAIYTLLDVIIALLFAVIFASALEPAVRWLKVRGVPRILATILLYLSLAGLLFLAVYFIVPILLDSIDQFFNSYADLQRVIFSQVRSSGVVPDSLLSPKDLRTALNLPLNYVNAFGGGVVNFITNAFGGIISFTLVAVLSFYLTAQERGIESFLRLVTPLAQEEYIIGLWKRAQAKLGRWFRAQILLGAIVGICIFFGLSLLGMQQVLLFALLAGLFEIIPVVGPILAAVPAVIAAFLVSPGLGLSVVILYIIVQQTESHIIVPVVMRRAVGLSPLVVVLALVIGARLGGIFGLLLAVPVTAIIAEFVEDWDKKKRAIMPE